MSRLLLIAGLLAAFGVAGCAGRSAPQSGGARGSKPDEARKQAELLTVNVVNGVAAAEAKVQSRAKSTFGDLFGKLRLANAALAAAQDISTPSKTTPATPTATSTPPAKQQPAPRPRLTSAPAIKELVASSQPAVSEADADEDALTVAQDTIERRLAELDPPVRYRPSVNELKNEFLRRDSRTVQHPKPEQLKELVNTGLDPKLAPNLVSVEYEIIVSADQVRELRTRDRLADGMRIIGLLTAVSLAGFGFLRLDQWTRGHLTRWLAIGAAALAGGAAAALYFV